MEQNEAHLGCIMGQPDNCIEIGEIISNSEDSADFISDGDNRVENDTVIEKSVIPEELPKKRTKRGRPAKIEKTSDLQQKIDDYFADDKNRPFCMSGLALALDMSRQCLMEYSHRTKEFGDAICRARRRIEVEVEQRLLEGKNASGIIFHLCNNFAWKSPQQHIESKNLNKNENTITIHSELSDEDLDKKLLSFESKTQAQG